MSKSWIEDLEPGAVQHYDDALYYDFTYQDHRDDIAFYREIAKQNTLGGPILELGAGSGRITIPLAREGHALVGIDASEPMLAQARVNAAEHLNAAQRKRITWVHGDMREFAFEQKFSLVIAPFNALLHLYHPADFARCFACVVRHMSPGARFVFDVRMPNLKELSRDPDRVYKARGFDHPSLGYRVRYEEQFDYDAIQQVQHVVLRMTPAKNAPPDAKIVETVLSQRQIFPSELRALLALGGLALDKRFGDYDRSPLVPDSSVQIIVARAITEART
ncbi:MAG: class I SAM-dependent methyltransferase [Deltaproteobacteria bacterium]|nr:class I SAM-dependent methyltransferase [Deltaproteobacteria bacterium]